MRVYQFRHIRAGRQFSRGFWSQKAGLGDAALSRSRRRHSIWRGRLLPPSPARSRCRCSAARARAASTGSRSPNFDYLNQRLRLSTDSTWGGAHVVDAGKFLNVQPDTSWPKLKRQWIWSASCGQQAQLVVFRKTFLAPGVPVSGNLNLYYGPGNQFLGNRPYESAVYEINGKEIGRLGNTARFPKKFAPELSATLSARALHAFRHGQNTATIRVDRAPLKKSDPCTHPNNAKVGGNVRYIAVLADLSLLFGADLRAVAPQTPQQVQHVTNGQTISLQGVSSFANDGPSTSLGGTVQLNAGVTGRRFSWNH